MTRPTPVFPQVLRLVVVATLLVPAQAAGQTSQAGRPQAAEPAPPAVLQDAKAVRDEWRSLLNMHPPSLGRVFKLDSSLMTSEAYLAPYPAVAAFLRQHPEIARNPTYFLSFIDQYLNISDPLPADLQARQEAIRLWNNTMEGLTFFLVFLTVTFTLAWLIKSFITHRRWLRATRVQSEVHGRLLERFGSNDELMAYIQSPAGSHFLKAMPIAADAAPAPAATLGAPINRILWSVQAGLVIASAGIGLLAIRGYVMEEIGELMLTLGVLSLSLGAGFVLAAGASYMLSQRLGLLEPAKPAPVDPDRPGA